MVDSPSSIVNPRNRTLLLHAKYPSLPASESCSATSYLSLLPEATDFQAWVPGYLAQATLPRPARARANDLTHTPISFSIRPSSLPPSLPSLSNQNAITSAGSGCCFVHLKEPLFSPQLPSNLVHSPEFPLPHSRSPSLSRLP